MAHRNTYQGSSQYNQGNYQGGNIRSYAPTRPTPNTYSPPTPSSYGQHKEREWAREREREKEREWEREKQQYYTPTTEYNNSPVSVVSDDETTDEEIVPPVPVESEPEAPAVIEEQRRIAVRNKQILYYGLGLITVLVLLVVFIGAWRLIKKSRRAKKALAHDSEFKAPLSYAAEKKLVSPMTGPALSEKDATLAYSIAGSGTASHALGAPMVYGNFGHVTKG